jgi:hypothetical protein
MICMEGVILPPQEEHNRLHPQSCQFVTNGRGAIMLVCIIGRWQEPTGITQGRVWFVSRHGLARIWDTGPREPGYGGAVPVRLDVWTSMDRQSLATCNTCLVARIARKHRCFSALLALPMTRTSQVARKRISFSFPGSQAGGG